jgi:hypothetical protein
MTLVPAGQTDLDPNPSWTLDALLARTPAGLEFESPSLRTAAVFPPLHEVMNRLWPNLCAVFGGKKKEITHGPAFGLLYIGIGK